MAEVQTRDILLRVGGRTLQRFGVAAIAGAGRSPSELVETFTRADASTCATYIDRDGIIRLAAANKVRIEWVDLDGDGIRETPGILLEGSRTNKCLRSEEFDNAAWVNIGTAGVAANDATAPDGTTTADKIEDDDGVAVEGRSQTIAVANDGADNVVGVFIRKRAGAPSVLVQGLLSGGTSVDARVMVNPATGAKTASGVSNHGVIDVNANFWFVWLGVRNNTSGNTSLLFGLFPAARVAGDVSSTGEVTSATGFNHFWGAVIETNISFPASYIKTVASAVTRAADSLTVPFNFGPMDTTVLVRLARPVWADASGDIGVFPGIWALGSESGTGLRLYGEQTTRSFTSLIDSSVDTTVAAVIPAGAELNICQQVRALSTAGITRLDVGSGFTADSSPATGGISAYTNQTLRVGAVNTVTPLPLYGVLLDLIIARGLFTRAEMLASP